MRAMVSACLLGATTSTACALDEAIVDKAMLRSLMANSRQSLAALQVSYTAASAFAGYPQSASPTPQTWTVGWNSDGFRVESLSAGSDATGQPALELWTRIFDGPKHAAVVFSGADFARVSSDPRSLGFQGLAMEYCSLIGHFLIRVLVGGEPPVLSDPVVLLASPDSVISPEIEIIDGYECTRIDLLRQRADGSSFVRLRGHYAPSLGYAQVRLEVYYPDGQLMSRWTSRDFTAVGDLTAVPMSGEWEGREADGSLSGSATYEVVGAADGGVGVLLDQPLSLALELPAGTGVWNNDIGQTQILEAPTPFTAMLASSGGPDEPTIAGLLQGWTGLIAIGCSIATLVVGCCWRPRARVIAGLATGRPRLGVQGS